MKRKNCLRSFLLLALLACLTVSAFASADSSAQQAADALYSLNLFKGTGTDASGKPIYSLDVQPSREVAVTMLVRLLGKEAEACSQSWQTPFTDVSEWALPYVGYAYTNGLTNGTSPTTFSGSANVNATQYLTLVLRSLGYSSDTDFKWDAAWELSDQLGITYGQYANAAASFDRGDIATISYHALAVPLKGTETPLLSSLYAAGVVPTDQLPAISEVNVPTTPVLTKTPLNLASVPAYSGSAYVILNGGIPDFSSSEIIAAPFELYSGLDTLGRCGTAYANISTGTIPISPRENIGSIQPTGWQTQRYDDLITGKYLYNRCHLIAYELGGENANANNLITGTRYMNLAMVEFENAVAAYVKKTENHVLYRATPVFEGMNLLASGVELEAYSVEDNGKGICWHVFFYNVQPGVSIDYRTGESSLVEVTVPFDITQNTGKTETGSGTTKSGVDSFESAENLNYVLNTNTMRFHYPSCGSVKTIKPYNRADYVGDRETLIERGFIPCGNCHP